MYELIGLVGGVFLVLAYGLLSFKVVSDSDFAYHFFNMLGACFLVISNWFLGAWPGAVVNIFFAMFATIGVTKSVWLRTEKSEVKKEIDRKTV